MANTPTPAAASGAVSELRIPVISKSNGPCTLRQTQPSSQRTPNGAFASSQTIDSSSAVRVIETNGPSRAQGGTFASASSLQTANLPSRIVRVSLIRFIALVQVPTGYLP